MQVSQPGRKTFFYFPTVSDVTVRELIMSPRAGGNRLMASKANTAVLEKGTAKYAETHGATSAPDSASAAPTLLTVPEVCKLLRLGRSSVYQGLRTGAIPGARYIGRALRVHLPTLEEWLDTGEVPLRCRGRK